MSSRPAQRPSASPWNRRGPAVAAGVLAVLLAVVAGGCSSDGGERSSAGTEQTTPAAEPFARLDPAAFAGRMNNSDAPVINVHIPYEGEVDPTDEFIPYDTIVGDSRLPADKNQEILLYCRSGRMSEEAGAALHAAGYTKVSHLEGGMKAWEASGRPLVHNPDHAEGATGD